MFDVCVSVPLTKGMVALIDTEDANRILAHKWCAFKGRNTFYAGRAIKRNGKWTTQSLHRFIMGEPDGLQIDHIDGDGLNCRKSNLRIATHAQNQSNRRATTHSSVYRGVSWHAQRGRWRAAINLSGKHIHIGHFNSEEDAARAYDMRAMELKGEFAALNFPNGLLGMA